jgi:hypothetical protein
MQKTKKKVKLSKFEQKCRESFSFFLKVVWSHLDLRNSKGEQSPPTPVQYEIANYLQYGPKRAIIEAFRGVGKSWITSAFVCWHLLRDPQIKILVVSASKSRADDFSTFTLRLIKELPVLKHLNPKTDQRESKVAFDVGPSDAAHASSVRSAGITGMITGSRAGLIIADDIEVPNNSATDDLREKLVGAVAEFNAILVPEGNPRIIFLGTPQTEESVYNKLRDRGYQARIWPSRYPNQKQIESYRGALAPTIQDIIDESAVSLAGRPTDPLRFNDADLIEREASYGRSGFALQFMLDTSLSDAERYPLKTADLICMDCNPTQGPNSIQYGSAKEQVLKESYVRNIGFAGDRWHQPMWYDKETWKPYDGIVMSVDPSGRGKDETGYAVVANLNGTLYILAAGGLKGGYDDPTLEALAQIAKKFKVKHMVIESNFGDGMYTKILSPVLQKIYPVTCEEINHSKQKELRIIDTLEPVMNQHRLVVCKSVIKHDLAFLMDDKVEREQRYSLFYQMTRLCKDRGALKHDDRLDALAQAVAYWTEQMDQRADKAAKAHKAHLLEDELRKHMESCLGRKLAPNDCFNSRFGNNR